MYYFEIQELKNQNINSSILFFFFLINLIKFEKKNILKYIKFCV
jgi:hypothetical protein